AFRLCETWCHKDTSDFVGASLEGRWLGEIVNAPAECDDYSAGGDPDPDPGPGNPGDAGGATGEAGGGEEYPPADPWADAPWADPAMATADSPYCSLSDDPYAGAA